MGSLILFPLVNEFLKALRFDQVLAKVWQHPILSVHTLNRTLLLGIFSLVVYCCPLYADVFILNAEPKAVQTTIKVTKSSTKVYVTSY